MLNQLRLMEIFRQVADHGSFSRAAAALHMLPGKVSTAIAQLEQHLGVRLLNRSTRVINLTAEGQAYHQHCVQILGSIQGMEAELSHRQTTPAGLLTVDMSTTMARHLVLPHLPEFLVLFPEIEVEFRYTEHIYDVALCDSDVMLRIGPFDDSGMVARLLYTPYLVTAASPRYLRKHGEPATPYELDKHNCISFIDPLSGRTQPWQFQKDGKSFALNPKGNVQFCEGELLVDAAVNGLGIVPGADFMFTRALECGELQLILGDWAVESGPIFLLYPGRRNLSAKVEAFVDFMVRRYTMAGRSQPALRDQKASSR